MRTIVSTITLILLAIISAFSQDLSGVWHGVTKTPDNKEVTFVFLFEKTDNTYTTTMAVPTFNVANIKPKNTSFNNETLVIEDSGLKMKYKGVWNNTTNIFEGIYNEGNIKLNLNLTKGNPKIAKISRPQEPVKPYPYYQENVTFNNTKAGVLLSGTFTRPNKKGQFPVVVLISGSGRHDRNGSAATHKPFLVLADYLTRNNIAVLRYDDRGFGDSTGDFSKATTADFAQDALSAIGYLKSRNDIDLKNIGLIGHSEGGIIAPLTANLSNDVAFTVLLAATGVPGKQITLMQAKFMRPFPVKDEVAFEKNIKKAHQIITSNKNLSDKGKELFAHNKSYLTPILKSLGASESNIEKFINNETESSLKPWTRYFLSYNPSVEIEKLKIPVLSLNGSKDVQVNAKINQDAIRLALIKGNNKNYKILEFENLNHMFQECKTGKISEYKDIEQTISPKILQTISNWITNNTK